MKAESPQCPTCGSSSVASILYGMPDFSDELQRELDAKRVTLGGCCITGDDPQWHCNECHEEFSLDP